MCSKPIFCSKVAQKGKIFSRLLEPQKVAPNAKSCSKVAEHNRERPTTWTPRTSWDVEFLLKTVQFTSKKEHSLNNRIKSLRRIYFLYKSLLSVDSAFSPLFFSEMVGQANHVNARETDTHEVTFFSIRTFTWLAHLHFPAWWGEWKITRSHEPTAC